MVMNANKNNLKKTKNLSENKIKKALNNGYKIFRK